MFTIWGVSRGRGGAGTRRDTAEHVEVALAVAREWIEDGLDVVTVSRDEGIGEMVLARYTAAPVGKVIVMPTVAAPDEALAPAA